MSTRLVPYATATAFALAALTVRAALTPWLGTLQPFAVLEYMPNGCLIQNLEYTMKACQEGLL